MLKFKDAVFSSLGRKYLMAITGIGLVGFTVSHLIGNLQLLLPSHVPFNQYAHVLASFGSLLYVVEIGLILLFLAHVVTAVGMTAKNKSARPIGYTAGIKSKGKPSKSNWGSRNMIITGMVLLIFLVLHVLHFKYGPGIEEGYVAYVGGEPMRDLHRWVYEEFQNPLMVALYCGVMLMLGIHVRHGFWSAFQSLGAMNRRYTAPVTTLGVLVALLLIFGFGLLPIWIYLDLSGVMS